MTLSASSARFAAVALVVLSLGATARAGEAIVRVIDQKGSDRYGAVLDGLAAAVSGAAQAAQQRPGSGPSLYVDLRAGAGEGALDAGDRAFFDAARRTFNLFEALGGRSDDRMAVVQRGGDRFYVGLDGDGGRWFADSSAALGFLLKRLVARSDLPAVAKVAVEGCGDFACVVQSARREIAKTEAIVPRGTTVALEMRLDGLAASVPVVIAPTPLVALDAELLGPDRVQARVAVLATTPLGLSAIHLFNEGRPFRPVASLALRVVGSLDELNALASGQKIPDYSQVAAGSGTVEALADDHANTAAQATELSGTVQGRIEVAGDVDVFRIALATAGSLSIVSSGPTDVAAILRSADGEELARDDDHGAWYNFSLTKVLPAGTYFLFVSHCCGGTGRYQVTETTAGN